MLEPDPIGISDARLLSLLPSPTFIFGVKLGPERVGSIENRLVLACTSCGLKSDLWRDLPESMPDEPGSNRTPLVLLSVWASGAAAMTLSGAGSFTSRVTGTGTGTGGSGSDRPAVSTSSSCAMSVEQGESGDSRASSMSGAGTWEVT